MTSKAAIYQQTGLFFTLTVDTTDQSRVGASNTDQYSLPLQDVSGIYSAIVVYNDEVIHTINSSSDNLITFPDGGGIKTFEIRGRLKGIQHANGGADNPKLLELKWGQCEFANFNNLRDCPNLSKVSGVPNLSNTPVFAFVFQDTPSLLDIEDLNEYDVSGITGATNQLFTRCPFNTFHGDWDTSQWTGKFRMYLEATNYNQPDNHDHTNVTNFNSYRFRNTAYNQVVNMHIPSATTLGLFMRECINQNKDINLTGTHNVSDYSAAFQGLSSFGDGGSGATISIESFEGATNLSNMLFGTKLTTANIDQILNQWVNTISTATGLPMANFTTDLGGSIPSAQGLLDIATLQGRGWTINNIGA
jgi:hypothetical protein